MARIKNPENYEKVKRSIIMATIEIMVKQSVSNFTLTDVAKSIGMTKAAIYWYFPNKETLIEELSGFIYQTYVDYAKEITSSDLNPYEKLIKLLIGRTDDIPSALMCLFPVKLFLEYFSDNNAMRAMIQKGYEEYNKSILKILADGIASGDFYTEYDINQLAKFISGAIDGLAFQNLLVSSETVQVPRTIILSIVEDILKINKISEEYKNEKE